MRTRRVLLALLALLIVAAVAEYTLGGGWKYVARAIKRRQAAAKLAQEGSLNWKLPEPMGPEDAKVTLHIFLNRRNPCHKEFAEGLSKALERYADRVRIVFMDIGSEEAHKLLEGIPIGCESVMLLNGLNKIKVPWRKRPIWLQEPMMLVGPQLDRIIEWALTDEGQKSLKKQAKEQEAERKRRAEKERKLRQQEKAKQEQSKGTGAEAEQGGEKSEK